MKIEEVILYWEGLRKTFSENMEKENNPFGKRHYQTSIEAMDAAITALRSMPEVGKPLSLEQLKQMDGKPVWVVPLKKEDWDSHWDVMKHGCAIAESKTKPGKTYFLYEDSYRIRWLAYSYPPAHIDRSEREPCEHCKPSNYLPDRWGAHGFPVVGNEIYFYDTEYGWEGEEIKYCPWCGRPLTEEAWAELERRVRG